MTNKFTVSFQDWVYALRQDTETGELVVESTRRVGVIEKAKEYVKAEASVALAEPLRLPVVEARKAACFGCDSMEQYEGHMYCKACGCPKWERSRLEVKWEMPGAKCTLGKWPE
jgi:hypothetical protein